MKQTFIILSFFLLVGLLSYFQSNFLFATDKINSHTQEFGNIFQKKKRKGIYNEDISSFLIKTADIQQGERGKEVHFKASDMMRLGNKFGNEILPLFKNNGAISAISFESLLVEMSDLDNITRFPQVRYRSLQSSSYNRASVSPNKVGWFADGDGAGWIREEDNNGRKEYIIMEYEGPGCITRMWTPYFYYNFNNHIGPNLRIYLDGNKEPVIDENFIALVTGNGLIKPPFADYTARAGVCFLPIPFSKSCKITLDDKPFYYIVNYRAYQKGTQVHSFSMDQYRNNCELLANTAENIRNLKVCNDVWHKSLQTTIKSGDSLTINLPKGNHAIQRLSLCFDLKKGLQCLRSTILKLNFDGQLTVWCPAGDFFCCPNTINQFATRNLRVSKEGEMVCSWVMPYSSDAILTVINLQEQEVALSINLEVNDRIWDERSMYFHANWKDIGPLPGNYFFDMNFIDIIGRGVLVGDALSVLSPSESWWGEGDEKIYVDEGVSRKFPSHFGTGTEDYYGWAGGVVPSGKDAFSKPFGANVRVGNPFNPRGYNICFRNRLLDDVPFDNRLIFDMEASPGTDIRNYWDLLSYSIVIYWYGIPGATSNRIPRSDLARRTLISLSEIERMQQMVKDSILIYQIEKVKNWVNDITY